MPQPRYLIALIKHETNTFSPIPTPLSAFGHGHGPSFGEAAKEAFRGSATPFAAYLDIAEREGARVVTPVAAESWPSGPCSRKTFETLMEPLEDAVAEGVDAIFLDLHGAMVIEDCDDAEGEILRRVRALAPKVPIAVTFDYHTNLSPETVALADVITGFKTYPHVDMYEAGRLAGEILVDAIKGKVKPVMVHRWLPIVSAIMRHAPEDGPSGAIIAHARAMEANGTVLAATLLPGFAHADTPYTGIAAVVIADGKRDPEAAQRTAARVADEMMSIAQTRRAEYVYHPTPLAESVRRARQLGEDHPDGPVLLIDHCDNCGSGGTQDVMTVVTEIIKQQLSDIAIAPIRDPEAVQMMIAAGIGNNLTLSLGGKSDMSSIGLTGKPLTISGRVRNITDGEIVFRGPMYTGLKSHLGPTAVLDTGHAQIVVTSLHHEPFDLVIFRHCGIEPTKKRYLMLKSRIHYRAGFKPIASHIVECHGEGVTNADMAVYRYTRLARPSYPLDLDWQPLS